MFKESQLYGWDAEPVDERPSEFMASGGYSMLSSDPRLNEAIRRRRSAARVGLIGLIAFVAVLFLLGGYALLDLLPMLVRH
jgi:hypothetical protein